MVDSDVAASARRVTNNILNAGKSLVFATLQNELPSKDDKRTIASLFFRSYGTELESGTSSTEAAIAQQSTEYLVYNYLESAFAWFQIVVLWHDPILSAFAICGILSSFLLLTYFAPRFYATIMIILFLYNLTKVWFRHVWPEIRVPPGELREIEQRLDLDRFTPLHPQLITLKELGQTLRNLRKSAEIYLDKLVVLRREKPVLFCSAICSILSCTAFIGNKIDGLNLITTIVAAILVVPGIYTHILPSVSKQYLRQSIVKFFFQKKDAQKSDCEEVADDVDNQKDEEARPYPSDLDKLSPARGSSIRSSLLPLYSLTQRLFVQMTSREKENKPSQTMDVAWEADIEDEYQNDSEDEDDEELQANIPTKKGGNTSGNDDLVEESDVGDKKINSSDQGSTSSASKTDFDEAKQDGFVIL